MPLDLNHHADRIARQTEFTVCPRVELRDIIVAASTGSEQAGSMMNSVCHIAGGVAKGQKICVPWTLLRSLQRQGRQAKASGPGKRRPAARAGLI